MNTEQGDDAIELEWEPAPNGESLEAYHADHRVPADFGVMVYHLRIERYSSNNYPDIFWWHVEVDNGNLDLLQHEHGHGRQDAEAKAEGLLRRFLSGQVEGL